MESIILQYLDALEKADLDRLLALFSENAMVNSPLYGMVPASNFYKELFADTTQSKLQLIDIFVQSSKPTAAVNFLYQWTLAHGEVSHFDCVDIFEFDKEGKIKSVKIIYDTARTRPVFEELKS